MGDGGAQVRAGHAVGCDVRGRGASHPQNACKRPAKKGQDARPGHHTGQETALCGLGWYYGALGQLGAAPDQQQSTLPGPYWPGRRARTKCHGLRAFGHQKWCLLVSCRCLGCCESTGKVGRWGSEGRARGGGAGAPHVGGKRGPGRISLISPLSCKGTRHIFGHLGLTVPRLCLARCRKVTLETLV